MVSLWKVPQQVCSPKVFLQPHTLVPRFFTACRLGRERLARNKPPTSPAPEQTPHNWLPPHCQHHSPAVASHLRSQSQKENKENKNSTQCPWSPPCLNGILADEVGMAPSPASNTSQKPLRMERGEGFHASGSEQGSGGLPTCPVQDCWKTTIWTNCCNYPPSSMESSRTHQQTQGSLNCLRLLSLPPCPNATITHH